MYGIIRVRNLKMGDINSTDEHNSRSYSEKDFPKHIDKNGVFKKYNQHGGYYEGETDDFKEGEFNLKECLNERLKSFDIKPRKNSIVALEYVLAISPEDAKRIGEYYTFGSGYDAVLNDLRKFIVDKHGAENIIQTSYHYDESNPHAHIVVVPIDKKIIKWKNKNGAGEKEKYYLNARDITGGREKMRKLQDDFFKHCESPFVRVEGFKRGVSAETSKKKYEQQTNAELGKIRNEIHLLREAIEQNKITADKAKELSNEQINKAKELKENLKEKEKELKKQQAIGKNSFDKTTKNILPKENYPTKKRGGGLSM